MGSVKSKIDAIKKQKEINKAAVKEIHVGVRAIQDKTKKFADEIKNTKDSFKDYIHKFYGEAE